MRYQHILRKSIYQHRDIDLAITGNVISLTGPNGSGKSNLLHSLRETLIGEVHKPFTKERVVSRGAKSGYAEDTVALADGTVFKVRREYPKGTNDSLTILNPSMADSHRVIATGAKVTNQVYSLLGVEKSILEDIVFVGQEDIQSILFAGPTEKARLAQKFFGIERANALEEMLGKELAKIQFDSSAVHLPNLLQRRTEAKTELEFCLAKADLLPQVSLEEISQKEGELRQSVERELKIAAVKELESSVAQLESELRSSEAAYSSEYASFQQINPQQIDDLLSQHQASFNHNAEVRRNIANLETANRKLAELGEAPTTQVQLDEWDRLADTLLKSYTEITQNLRHFNSLLNNIGTSPVCPTCHQKVDLEQRKPIEQDISRLNEELKVVNTQREQLRAKCEPVRKLMSQWTTSDYSLRKNQADAQAAFAAKGNLIQPEPDPDKYRSMKQSYNTLVTNLNQQHAAMEVVRTKLNAAKLKLDTYAHAKLRDSAGNFLPVLDHTSLEKEIVAMRQHYTEGTDFRNRVEIAKSKIVSLEESIKNAQAAANENTAAERYRLALLSLRQTFHPDGAPRILVTRRTQQMQQRINQRLSEMNARYHVQVKEGLNFDCVFSDGTAQDAELSVGQQISLAWAFRFAACETFASSVGLMTLDEPSPSFDTSVKQGFAQVMENLKDVAVKYNMQFFIATHDPTLARFCDQAIELASPTV